MVGLSVEFLLSIKQQPSTSVPRDGVRSSQLSFTQLEGVVLCNPNHLRVIKEIERVIYDRGV